MSNLWFISDTHFQHKNIIKYCRPGFTDVTEMNEYMIEQWNAHIKPEDNVVHCGDVMFGNKDSFVKNIAPRLNGTIDLIIGNHDDPGFLLAYEVVRSVQVWYPFKRHGFVISHIPLHEDYTWGGNKEREYEIVNVHGHIHNKNSPEGRYHNICVEKTEFKPLHLDTLKQRIAQEH